jgi:hypothetical protein
MGVAVMVQRKRGYTLIEILVVLCMHPRSYGRRNPNRLSYRLWSCGPDGRSQPLESSSDDLPNWDKASPNAADGD